MTTTPTEATQSLTAGATARGVAPRAPRSVRPAVNAKLVAAAVGIIVVSVAGAAALFGMVSGTTPVVVAAAPLAAGQLITDQDLTTAAVAADPSVAVIPGDQLGDLIGQRAAVAVPAGALLAPDSVTTDLIPGPGQALVGIPVTSAQAPLAELAPGTPVRLVHVPDTAGPADPGAGPVSAPVPAVVVSTGVAPDGARVIDVTVAAAAAPTVSGWAAGGDVAVVVDTEARG
jgi:hypothetical protein